MPSNPFVETTWNPKGVLFWMALTGIAVNASIAYGPQAGMGVFALLAVLIAIFG